MGGGGGGGVKDNLQSQLSEPKSISEGGLGAVGDTLFPKSTFRTQVYFRRGLGAVGDTLFPNSSCKI